MGKIGPSDLYRRSLTEPDGWRERDKARDAAFVDAMPEVRDAHLGGYSYEASMLRDLLARIHEDGGQYLEAHGLDKALEAAHAKAARWSAAKNEAETNALKAAQEADELRATLRELVAMADMKARLENLHAMGHGTDWDGYHKRHPAAWAAARRLALGPNLNSATPPVA